MVGGQWSGSHARDKALTSFAWTWVASRAKRKLRPLCGELFFNYRHFSSSITFWGGACFRPLFGELFFNNSRECQYTRICMAVFVPSSGNCFLISTLFADVLRGISLVFVPSSGNCFLISLCLGGSFLSGLGKPIAAGIGFRAHEAPSLRDTEPMSPDSMGIGGDLVIS